MDNNISEEKFIEIIHTSLDTYPVFVYNGEEHPVQKTLPQALTHISEDVRNLKVNIKENSTLLEGIRTRKKLVEYLSNFVNGTLEFFNVRKILTAIVILAGGIAAIKGIVDFIDLLVK